MINLLALTTPTTQTWVTLGVVAGIFAGSALLIGALILVIGKVFKVDMDEKVTKIMENLAGANCGGCGCSGCGGFAQKLAQGNCSLNDCHVTSPEKKAEIAKLLGIELTNEEPTVAVVHCNGGVETARTNSNIRATPPARHATRFLAETRLAPTRASAAATARRSAPRTRLRSAEDLRRLTPTDAFRAGLVLQLVPKILSAEYPPPRPYTSLARQTAAAKRLQASAR